MTIQEASLKFSKWIEQSNYYYNPANNTWSYVDQNNIQTDGITDDQVWNVFSNAPDISIVTPPPAVITINSQDFTGGTNHTDKQLKTNFVVVGIITPGRLDYTIKVEVPGMYTLKAKVCAPATGVKFNFLDGSKNNLGNIDVPATNDWNTYEDISFDLTAPLQAGTQTVSVLASSLTTAGISLNFVSLTLTKK